MKKDKEYPATHSMSTAWYMADEDGNVGIMDFNENGPIPWGLGEYSLNELVIGDVEEDELGLKIELTEDQIFELLGEPLLCRRISLVMPLCSRLTNWVRRYNRKSFLQSFLRNRNITNYDEILYNI
jgi:hypothetical protein